MNVPWPHHALARIASTLGVLAVLGGSVVHAQGQSDPGLGNVIETAIGSASCDASDNRFDTEVYYKLQEPRLKPLVRDAQERHEILHQVWCESHRVVKRYKETEHVTLNLPPELVLAVIDVESRFNRYAVSPAGAVGLMQVMPYWPRRLGVNNRLFGSIDFNIRLGCEILAFYLHLEGNNHQRALARYNGSIGRHDYSDMVLSRLANRWAS